MHQVNKLYKTFWIFGILFDIINYKSLKSITVPHMTKHVPL